MNNYQKKISTSIYLVLGVIFTVGGLDTLFENPFVCLPLNNVDTDSFLHFFQICQGILHLFMDLSATYALIGFLFLWSSLNYDRSQSLDYFFLVFFFFSFITHWNESFNIERNVNNPLFTFIPLLFVSTVIILRKIEEYNKHVH